MGENLGKLQSILSVTGTDAKDKAVGFLQDVKASDLLAAVKLNEIVEEGEDRHGRETIKNAIIIAVVVTFVIAVIYAIYKYLSPEYLGDEYEEDMENDFAEDPFEDEVEDEETAEEN